MPELVIHLSDGSCVQAEPEGDEAERFLDWFKNGQPFGVATVTMADGSVEHLSKQHIVRAVIR